jgi:hypothetical protein
MFLDIETDVGEVQPVALTLTESHALYRVTDR